MSGLYAFTLAVTVNTLVLAHGSASLPMLLLFSLGNGNYLRLLNYFFIAAEIIRTLVGPSVYRRRCQLAQTENNIRLIWMRIVNHGPPNRSTFCLTNPPATWMSTLCVCLKEPSKFIATASSSTTDSLAVFAPLIVFAGELQAKRYIDNGSDCGTKMKEKCGKALQHIGSNVGV